MECGLRIPAREYCESSGIQMEIYSRKVTIVLFYILALAELVRDKATQTEQLDETAKQIANLIVGRCESVLSRFK